MKKNQKSRASHAHLGLKKAKMKKKGLTASQSHSRHHFQSFDEQMLDLKVPKINFQSLYTDPTLEGDDSNDVELSSSCFGSTLIKHRELNLSQTFVDLIRRCAKYSSSVRHVVHNKAKIVQDLKEASAADLSVNAPNMHLESILEMWCSLAMDLQEDFEPFFQDMVKIVITAMSLKKPEVIKGGFGCLEDVLKIVQRKFPAQGLHFVQVILENVHRQRQSLSDQALCLIAQAVASGYRRSKEKKQFTHYFVQFLMEKENLVDFIVEVLLRSSMLNPMLKNKPGNLDQRGWKMTAEITQEKLGELTESFWKVLYGSIGEAFAPEDVLKACEIFLDVLPKNWHSEESRAVLITKLVTQAVVGGSKVTPVFLLNWIQEFAPRLSPNAACFQSLSEIFLLVFEKAENIPAIKTLLEELMEYFLCESPFALAEKSQLISGLASSWSFDHVCFPKLLDFWQANFDFDALPHIAKGLKNVCEHKSNLYGWQAYVMEIPLISRTNTLPNQLALALQASRLGELDHETVRDLLVCLVFVRPVGIDPFTNSATAVQSYLLEHFEEYPQQMGQWILHLTRAMSKLICPNEIFDDIQQSVLKTIGSNCDKNEDVIEALSLLATLDAGGTKLQDAIVNLDRILIGCLSNAKQKIRFHALQALSSLKKDRMYQSMINIENVESTVQCYRNKLRLMESVKASGKDDLLDEAGLRYLIGQLFVSFSYLWKPTIAYIDQYSQNMSPELFWKTFEHIFKTTKDEFARKQLLTCLETISITCEKRCRFLTDTFLDDTLEDNINHRQVIDTFLKVFCKFENLRSTKRFDELLIIAYLQLSDSDGSSQEVGINFVCEAFKEVKQQKELLKNTVDKHKWKGNLRVLAENFSSHSFTEKVKDVLKRLIVGLTKTTLKDKAKRQKHARRFIVEQCSIMGEEFLYGLLMAILENSVPQLADTKSNKTTELLKKRRNENLEMTLDMCVLAAPFIKTNQDVVMKLIVDIMCLIAEKQLEAGNGTKTRSKILNLVSKVFNNAKHFHFTLEQETMFMSKCLLPILTRDSNDSSVQVSNKLLALIDSWLATDQFFRLFFIKGSDGTNFVDKISNILSSKATERMFASQLLDRVCQLVTITFEMEKKDPLFDPSVLYGSLVLKLLNWLSLKDPLKMKIKFDARMAVLTKILQSQTLSPEQIKECIERLSDLPSPKLGENHLHDWFSAIKSALDCCDQIPEKAFKLLIHVKEFNYQKKVALLLVGFTDLKFEKDDHALDPYTLVSNYVHTKKNFLYLLNCCFAQIMSTDLGQTTPALNALLWLLEKLKNEQDKENFEFMCQQYLTKPIQKGLRSKDDTIFTSCVAILQYILKTGKMTHLTDLAELCSDEEEVDFYENMKHLQVHRRSRAIRNLSKRILDESSHEITKTSLTKYIQPMITRYLFNTEFRNSSDLISSCITLMGSICRTVSLPSYVKILEQFIREETTDKAFAKQKFTLVATILQNFNHSIDEVPENIRGQLKRIVGKLLQSIKGDDSEGNLHVFVALSKMATLFPQLFNELIQSLLIELCNKLRSKDFDFRQAVRKTLSEVMRTLGPSYLHFLVSVLETSLQRGYQLHICIYTISYVTHAMKEVLEPSSVAAIWPKIKDYACKELFSDLAKEKKVKEIFKKTPEAAKISSYPLIEMLASNAGKDSLKDIVKTFLQPSIGALDHEKLQKCRNCLQSITLGLVENYTLSRSDLLIFSYAVISGKLLIKGSNGEEKPGLVALRKEFSLNLLLTLLKKNQNVTLSEIQPLLVRICDCLEEKNMDLTRLSLKLLTILMQSNEVMDYLKEEKLSHSMFKFIHTNLKRFYSMKDSRNFSQSCVVLHKLLKISEAAMFGNTKETIAALKAFFLNCLEREPAHSPKILMSVLKYVPMDETREVVGKLCKTYVECNQERTVQAIFSILRHQRMTDFTTEFMLQNFVYEGIDGRRKAVRFVAEMMELPKDVVKCDTLPKLFLISSQRLMNEDQDLIKAELGKIVKSILKRQFLSKEFNVTERVIQWAANRGENQLLLRIMAAKIGALACELEGEAATDLCGKILEKLRSGFAASDAENAKNDMIANILLKATLTNMVTQLLDNKPDGCEVASQFLSEHAELLSNDLLHPNTHYREKVVALVSKILSLLVSGGPRDWNAAWVSDERINKVEANLLEILKLSASTSLDNFVEPLFSLGRLRHGKGIFSAFVKKILSVFFHEKKTDPNTYIRRIPIMSLIKKFALSKEEPRLIPTDSSDVQNIVRLCVKNEGCPDLALDIEDILAHYKTALGMENYTKLVHSVTGLKSKLQAGGKRKLIMESEKNGQQNGEKRKKMKKTK